jgi:Rod binding domain-containing protein
MPINGIDPSLLPLDISQRSVGRPGPDGEQTDKKLWKAVQGFESLFMSQLLKSMEATLEEDSMGGKGLPGMMFNQVMSSAISDAGGIGLAEIIYRKLQAQEVDDQSENGNIASLQNLIMPSKMENSDD